MDSMEQNNSSRTRSVFRSPFFAVGCVLWLLVAMALAGLWMRQQGRGSRSPADSDSNARGVEQGSSSDGQRSIVLTTNRDGETVVVDGGRVSNEQKWDADGIADFEFKDTEGRSVTKADLLGKPWVVCFVFTHCAATCPTVTNSMRELQDRLNDYDFRLVTLTVDPERDTPEVLKGYGEARGADFSKWLFLSGEQKAIYRLIHGSFKMPVQESLGKDRRPGFEFIHSNNIMLVDAMGVVQGKFDATKSEAMSTLRREIQKIAKTYSSGSNSVVE